MSSWREWWPFGRKSSSLDLLRHLGWGPVKSGQTVNAQTALQVMPVLACLRVLADGVAQVPLRLYRLGDDGRSRQPAKTHPLYSVLYGKPNDWQTSFEFRETLMFHTALTGNFFAFKSVVQGRIVELIPFEPAQVTIKRNDRTFDLTYDVRAADGSKETFPASAIWHLRGPSWNTWMGLDAVKQAREAIGLALATEEHHASLHKNGARVAGLLSVEGNLDTDQYKKLSAWIEEHYVGSGKAGGTMLLDRATKFTAMAQNGVDAEHLATRRFQIEEICRAFRVMPIMVGQSEKVATYASAEQMFLAHVVHTLAPWYQRIEQSIDANLLSEEDRAGGLYAKFNANALMRGAAADRAEFYAKALGSGGSPAWMVQNEPRELEDMNPIAGWDSPPVPTNVAPAPAASPAKTTE